MIDYRPLVLAVHPDAHMSAKISRVRIARGDSARLYQIRDRAIGGKALGAWKDAPAAAWRAAWLTMEAKKTAAGRVMETAE